MIDKLRAWFTAKRRTRIYAAVAAIAPLLVFTGTLVEGQVDHILTITSVTLQAFGGLLALANYTPTAAASWFVSSGRAVLYGLVAAVAPAAVGLGWVTTSGADTILSGFSLSLSALASVVAVITLTPDSAPASPALPE